MGKEKLKGKEAKKHSSMLIKRDNMYYNLTKHINPLFFKVLAFWNKINKFKVMI